jgi:hypothetical protein
MFQILVGRDIGSFCSSMGQMGQNPSPKNVGGMGSQKYIPFLIFSSSKVCGDY